MKQTSALILLLFGQQGPGLKIDSAAEPRSDARQAPTKTGAARHKDERPRPIKEKS